MTVTRLIAVIACLVAVSATTFNKGFYNIAHMANTRASVDWALGKGANAVEVDVEFSSSTGNPRRFIHSPKGESCDCTCMCPTGTLCGVFYPNSICPVLRKDKSVKVTACSASSPMNTLLNHMAKKSSLALVIIDSKIDGKKISKTVQEKAASKILNSLVADLFAKGYKGSVIIGAPKLDALSYIKKIAELTPQTDYHDRLFTSIDMEKNNIGGVINNLKEAYPTTTQNIVYGTGQSACWFTPITKKTERLAALNRGRGVVGMTYVWTLDKDVSLKRAVWFWDGVITNYPGKLYNIVRKEGIQLAKPGDLIKPSKSGSKAVTSAGSNCDCDYRKGGCIISRLPSTGSACRCIYKGLWSCTGISVKCLDTDSAYCKRPQKNALTCVQGGGDCMGYKKENCDCNYSKVGGCKIVKPVPAGTACRCFMAGPWRCRGELVKCRDPNSAKCKSPAKDVYSCIEGGGDCGGYPACDCNYHPGGCSISKAAPPNSACKCRYKKGWTCKGSVVQCLDSKSPDCLRPSKSIQSCAQAEGGDCQGYRSHGCDCNYKKRGWGGGCRISKVPPKRTACKCKYKGAWSCGGDVVQCQQYNNPHCQNPDKSKATCGQGRGDCDGY